MLATFQDAHLIFARWKDDLTSLRVKLWTPTLVFEATAYLGEFTHAALQLNGPDWQLTLPIEGSQYTFSDPREIPIPSIRHIETARYEFGLAIELASGHRLVLMELKSSGEEES
jgi:hypothetical protein